jgi:flagellin
MTGIVLSASVRQNLLSLQSTASLLATTQNDLSTGNKVNTALDNPTSYFTAAALNGRAGDISNLLDGIGNGVQVLQAANTGITSLQSLVASAQSVANQVLQSSIGYSSKSSVQTPPISGAGVNNLLGTGGATAGSVTAGTFSTLDLAPGTATTPATTATAFTGTAPTNVDLTGAQSISFTLDVDGVSKSININPSTISTYNTNTSSALTAGNLTAANIASLVNYQFAGGTGATTPTSPASVVGGDLQIASSAAAGPGSNVTISGYASTATSGDPGLANYSSTGAAQITGTTADSEAFTVTVNNTPTTITLDAAHVTAYNSAKGTTLNSTSLSAADVASLINYQYDPSGATSVASVVGGALKFTSGTTGTGSTVSTSGITGSATGGSTGIVASSGTPGTAGTNSLNGEVLTIGATGGGTASNITFGTGAGQVSTLNQLNAALNANNLQATIDSTGVLSITTSNNAASSTIGAIGGTAAATGAAFAGLAGGQPVQDPTAQATRAGLVSQYNNILKQIDTTAQDSSFNGVNLLEGDTLNLTFDETGKSTLAIQGVTFNTAGLSLSPLTAGTDFLDSNSALNVLNQLNASASTLRTEASDLGSNLSIVQIRQDFSKNLINVLQTGASNLTLADTNEEAANSQALSTRQSIAVSALALANQSQQSVLQLLK